LEVGVLDTEITKFGCTENTEKKRSEEGSLTESFPDWEEGEGGLGSAASKRLTGRAFWMCGK